MSGIIGGAGSKSGIVGGLESHTTYHVNSTHTGGIISGWTKKTDMGVVGFGADWTIAADELQPPWVGYWAVSSYVTFYAGGNNTNDNAEGNLQFKISNTYHSAIRMRVGDQYDGTYTRGGGYNGNILKFDGLGSGGNWIRLSMGNTTDSLARDYYLQLTYMKSI